jgi:hypothetical protein
MQSCGGKGSKDLYSFSPIVCEGLFESSGAKGGFASQKALAPLLANTLP